MASSNQIAIVTGAARPWGLGRRTALGLARKGLDIVVADIRDDWGREAAEAILAPVLRVCLHAATDRADPVGEIWSSLDGSPDPWVDSIPPAIVAHWSES